MGMGSFIQSFYHALLYGIFGVAGIFLILGGGWLFLDSVNDNQPLIWMAALLISFFGVITLYLVMKVGSTEPPRTNTPA